MLGITKFAVASFIRPMLGTGILLFAVFVAAAVAEDSPTLYTFKTVDVNIPGANGTTALGINAEGHIAGRYMIGKTILGYLLKDGQLTTIDDPQILPSAPVTYANGVNPEDAVAGYYLDPPPGTVFLIWCRVKWAGFRHVRRSAPINEVAGLSPLTVRLGEVRSPGCCHFRGLGHKPEW